MSAIEKGVPRIGASLKTHALETKSATDNLETKSGPAAHEVRDALDDFLGAFEEFKEANDERLGQIERKLTADVVTDEKVDRINRALDTQKKHTSCAASKPRRWPRNPTLTAAISCPPKRSA